MSTTSSVANAVRQGQPPKAFAATPWLPLLILFGVLLLANARDYVLFHTLSEIFTVGVALLAGVVAWHTYPFSRNGMLLALGCGLFWVGSLDLSHALSLSLLWHLPPGHADISLQYWLAARLLEAGVLLAAPLFLGRTPQAGRVFIGFGLVALALFLLTRFGNLPIHDGAAHGAFTLKLAGQALVVAMLVAAIGLLWLRRHLVDRLILHLLIAAIAVSAASELIVAANSESGGLPGLFSHLAELTATWLVYVALVRTTLAEPFRVLARGATTFDAVPDAIVVVDREGRIRQTNRAARAFAGRSEEECLGQDCHTLFHPPDLPRSACRVCRHVAGERITEAIELQFRDPPRWFSVSLSRMTGAPDLTGMVHVMRDITARRESDDALRESLEQLGNVLQSVGDAIFGLDIHERATFVNPAFEQLTGWTLEEVLDQPVHKLIHHTGIDGQPYPFKHCPISLMLRDGTTRREQHERFWRKDGSGFDVEFTAAPLHAKDGAVIGAVVVFRDISRRVAIERSMQESERKYRAIMDSASDAIVVVDEEGRLVDVNRQAETLFGRPKEALLGLTAPDLHPPSEFASVQAAFHAMNECGHSLFEHLILRGDGSITSAEVAGTRVRYGDRTIYVGVFRDLSSRRAAETRTQELQEQLAHMNRLGTVAEVATSLAHEINQPLGSIVNFAAGAAQRIRNGNAREEDLLFALERIGNQARAASDIVRHVRGFARRRDHASEVSTVAATVDAALELLQGPLRKAGVLVQQEIAANLPEVLAAPLELRQILVNLILNAIEAMAPVPLPERLLHIQAVPEGGLQVRLSVSDNGPDGRGTDAEALFRPFQSGKPDGLGMGLAICRTLTESVGGRIWAEPNGERGMRFQLLLRNADRDALGPP